MPNPIEVQVAATAKAAAQIMEASYRFIGPHLERLSREQREAVYRPFFPVMTSADAPFADRIQTAVIGLANCHLPFSAESPVAYLMAPWLDAQPREVKDLASNIGKAGGRLIRLGPLLGEYDDGAIYAYDDLLSGQQGKVAVADKEEESDTPDEVIFGLYHEAPSHIVEVINSGIPPYAAEVVVSYLRKQAEPLGLSMEEFAANHYTQARLGVLRVEAADPLRNM
jgi:hypothetical protein